MRTSRRLKSRRLKSPRRYSAAAVLVLVAFGYGSPLVIAADSYSKSGRAYVQASKGQRVNRLQLAFNQACPDPHDWGCVIDVAGRLEKGFR
jgi:hypothetical protein